MIGKLLIVAMLATGGTASIGVNLTVTPGVQTPPPAPPRHPGSGWAPLVGAAGVAGTTVVLWPKGHRLRACNPNLDPDSSAWRDLLKEANGRLCTVTRVPA
ncbi:MAG: hypothetical protein HYX28_02760 [Candidatus Koribacter versatilis]|uniref:Uncharacterized protein n=1 Tax=Candidatus Korobacter versatilis TaxID=658062 RepID=A0A932ENU4_9BACT|nr:hypothetical protein [Candidatus Koribacter versatilis]